jgi:hypothetical protein
LVARAADADGDGFMNILVVLAADELLNPPS